MRSMGHCIILAKTMGREDYVMVAAHMPLLDLPYVMVAAHMPLFSPSGCDGGRPYATV